MKKILSFLLIAIFIQLPIFAQKGSFAEIKQLQSPQSPKLGFMIHGGAGVIRRGDLTPEKEKAYRANLEASLLAGYKKLQEGKSGLDAVQAAINLMEDSPLFNAGKGAVFTADGKNELDAAIMDGKNLKAGAVAGLRHVKNPINLARAVMEKSPHVMMVGEGAEQFAKEQKIEMVDEKYFFTQERFDALQKVIKEEEEKKKKEAEPKKSGQISVVGNQKIESSQTAFEMPESVLTNPYNKFGTVGAVALDKDGNLAAGTSTGGMTYKKYGRVGDAPIIGAGTFADNRTCAVSATGWGEYFIRLGVARDISALMEYTALPIQQAADKVIREKLQKIGGDGGIIAIDQYGNMAVSFNSEGMYRAYIDGNGKPIVEIYKN